MVFVLSSDKKPLDPCNEARARKLLNQGKATIFKQYPFTIILKSRWSFMSETGGYRLKIDPGSKITGMAIIRDDAQVVFACEIKHRSDMIARNLLSRRGSRRSRRARHTRYRQARFDNRKRHAIIAGQWLVPSCVSRISHVQTWIRRFMKLCPIDSIACENVKFDTQKMQNAEISGVEYQQGELQGYEIKEYLLEKYGHKCVYCGVENVPLEVDHIKPRSKGGSDRISNLTIACIKCNQKKTNLDIDEFIKDKDKLAKVKTQLKGSLKDTAGVSMMRNALYRILQDQGIDIEFGSGGLTKYNRHRLGLQKEHWIDALCVGQSTPDKVFIGNIKPLRIKSIGHGSRQMCRVDKYGFPRSKAKSGKKFFGFQTHDIVKFKNLECRIKSVRQTGSFTLENKEKDINSSYKNLQILQHADGYTYSHQTQSVKDP
ncbi:MAG: RNA-guided endonuclease IscB [Candidatus Poribacteria bacterium]